MKKLRKMLALTVAAAMTAASLTAFAAEEVQVDLGVTGEAGTATAEQAIAVAKLTFDIPEELSQCDYVVNDSGGAQEFEITWSDPERERSVSVTVNSRLVPSYYRDNTFDEPHGLSEIRKAALLESAKAFLQKTVPQLAGNLVYNEESSGGVRFNFDRYENGIRVENNQAQVYMSRFTGKVRSYSLTWDFDSQFTATGGIEADRAYSILNDKGVRTQYEIFEDKAFPVYVYNNLYVDSMGQTFDPISYYAFKNLVNAMSYDADEEMSAASGDGGSGGGYRLTREEITAVEKMNSLISREKIEEIIASLPELSLPEKYDLQLRYISSIYEDRTEYTVSCDFENLEGEGYAQLLLDAERGEVKNFYSWNDRDYRSSFEELTDSVISDPYDSEKCGQIAEDFIRKIKNVDGYQPDSEKENYSNGGGYLRYIDGVPFPADYKQANVSPKTGKITRYYENVPRVEIVTPAAMADRLTAVKNSYDAELVYTYKGETADGKTMEIKPVLARKLTPKTSFYVLKAEDGSPIGYDGEAPEPYVQKNDETDHPAWEAFDILRDNDITLTGSWAFDDSISKGDFDSLLNMLGGIEAIPYYYYRFETVYEDSDAPITREEAARMTAVKFGWDKLIDLDIYSVQFADREAFTGGVGAAAILQGLGIISAGTDGSFRPADAFTYGDAFILAYNLARAGLNAAG